MKNIKTVNFSTTMSESTKALLEKYCKKRGYRMNHVVEEAILDYLEDMMDQEIIHSRKNEPLVPWKKHG